MRVVLLLLSLAACQQAAETSESPADVPEATVVTQAPLPDPAAAQAQQASWAGKWSGPEGTSLVIQPAAADFTVMITNLDGEKVYAGASTAAGIVFERDDQTLTIRAGSGKDTGMKWLADKSDCLVVAPNEGYCRS